MGPSPVLLWSALLVGAFTCSSAGVVFDELTSLGIHTYNPHSQISPPINAAALHSFLTSYIV